jgi:hypothetical protein
MILLEAPHQSLDRAQRQLRRGHMSENNGAGEGIRTLDPDLGKVVLYP